MPSLSIDSPLPILTLVASRVILTFAWYGYLKEAIVLQQLLGFSVLAPRVVMEFRA